MHGLNEIKSINEWAASKQLKKLSAQKVAKVTKTLRPRSVMLQGRPVEVT